MGTFFFDSFFSKNQDPVGIFYGCQAVGYGQSRTAVRKFFQALADKNFTFVVKGAGCFIKQKNLRIF